ncbi:hypothetical protein [Methylobacterium sp. J-090]|uniref:hypothetical protein n=1 Tax=Methylobacterium sp. J-090 TaxID=2836666 RepID=UPI001FB8B0FE|nr:hypothetical protein [Methylobacterium sp. J-090]MCJ2079698.1 hypothetical protein [Methylobacterium sp. J-090]
MSQNHFTLRFPLVSPADAAQVAERLLPLMPALSQAADELGTIHYARFTVLSDKTLLFLVDHDGGFDGIMSGLASLAGPVFDAIFEHVSDPPGGPVADRPRAFVDWTAKHLLRPLNVYSAYPSASVKDIKSLAAAAHVRGGKALLPFLVILPIRSDVSFLVVRLLLRLAARKITRDLDTVGTPHFAQFVPLENNQIGFFTVYDGDFDRYIADFTKNIGQVFDLIFKFTKDPPPSPCRKHLQAFIDFAAVASRTPIGFYQAYSGLTVQDIHALVADAARRNRARPKMAIVTP